MDIRRRVCLNPAHWSFNGLESRRACVRTYVNVDFAFPSAWVGPRIPARAFPPEVDSWCDSTLNILCRAKGFQHQRMTNGAMNVEIGNPAYKIYEGEPDEDAGELLDADFTLDPDKVKAKEPRRMDPVRQKTGWVSFVLFSSPPTSPTPCMPRCTWELTTAATRWPAQTRTKSCYHVETRSPSWTPWHRLCILKSQTRPFSCL